MKPDVNLGVIIALKEEFREFISEFGNVRPERDPDTGRHYYIHDWSGSNGVYRCAATFIGAMGPEEAALATKDFLEKWKPDAIAMLGIAGGIHEDVRVGDVVLADQVDGYHASGKIGDSDGHYTIQFAGEVYRCPEDLVRDIDNIEFANPEAFNQWREDCAANLKTLLPLETIEKLVGDGILGSVPKLEKAHVASGPFVVVSEHFKQALKNRDRSIKAVEMEGFGVMKAVYQQIRGAKTIILRGVSDHGDADKKKLDETGKGALRKYAMRNTILLLKTLLQLNLIPKSERPVLPPESNDSLKIQIAKLPVTGEDLFGREKELKILDDAWEKPDTTILTLVAFGGVGKSCLVNHWLNRMGRDNFRGAGRVYGWSFYSQGAKEGTQASADEFFAQALEWFGDPDPVKGSPWDRGVRLAGLVRESRALLILDGLEPIQYPPGPMQGRLKDQGLQALTRELRQYNPGLLVITTRIAVEDIADAETVKRIDLENLSEHAGARLLEKLGAKGSPDELKAAVGEFGGHALALNLLGRFISVVHEGDIRKRDRIGDLTEEVKHGGHARRVMASYDIWLAGTPEHDILHLMGLFDRPADGGAIRALRKPPAIPGLTDKLENLPATQWQFALQHLRDLRLLAKKDEHRPDTLDCHPLEREHFGEKLRREKPNAWKQAHSRLYDYFRDLPKKELPDTLEEMEPLFAAVAHGCLAGRYQEAYNEIYYNRINRGNDYYISQQLGAFGARISVLSNFFKEPWHSPAKELKESDAAELFNNAGISLCAVGRLRESAQPMQAGMEASIENENWIGAAIDASNLSEILLTLGDVARAVEYGRQGLEFACRSGDWIEKRDELTTLADSLHYKGGLSEAESLFIEAETLQKERQPEYHYLYHIWGYRFCDLLLSQERYGEVRERAEKTIEIAIGKRWLLYIALDTLSIGRSFLLQAVTENINDDTFDKAGKYLDRAVEGLRSAGQMDYLPLGLLARALLHRVTQDFDKAHADLEEVRELAEQSEMKLFLADYHLESARLARDRLAKEGGPDLQTELKTHVREARKLIEECGYGRRKGELAELEGI